MSNASAPRSGAGARLVNVVADPVAAFGGISDDPSWRLAFLVVVAIRFASLFIFYQPAVAPIKLLGGLLFQILTVGPTVLLASVIAWLIARVWRLGVGWPVALSIVMHIYVAYTLATVGFASVAGALSPESADVDLRNPPFTNLTSLVAGTDSELVRTLAGEVDVRSAYAFVLLWLAFRHAAPNASRSVVARVLLTVAFVRVTGAIAVSLVR